MDFYNIQNEKRKEGEGPPTEKYILKVILYKFYDPEDPKHEEEINMRVFILHSNKIVIHYLESWMHRVPMKKAGNTGVALQGFGQYFTNTIVVGLSLKMKHFCGN